MRNLSIALRFAVMSHFVLTITSAFCPVNTNKGLKGKVKILERSALVDNDNQKADDSCWVRVKFGQEKQVSGFAKGPKLCSDLAKGTISAEVAAGCCEPRSTEFPCGLFWTDSEGKHKLTGSYSILN